MIVTINTDASFSNYHRIGTFAFWIVCNAFKIQKAGVLRKKCGKPEIAELRCIINAVHVLYKKDLSRVSKIIINSDCLNAIHLLSGDKENIQRYRLANWGDPLVAKFKAVLATRKPIPIEYRHVRSHTGVKDARSWVNEWCDRSAKEQMGLKINSICEKH